MKKDLMFIILAVILVGLAFYLYFSQFSADLAPVSYDSDEGLELLPADYRPCECKIGRNFILGNKMKDKKWPLGDCETEDGKKGHWERHFNCVKDLRTPKCDDTPIFDERGKLVETTDGVWSSNQVCVANS